MLIFNRPETTRRVFDAVRRAGPPRLLIVADGPRPDRPREAERCAEARAIVERIDWECELEVNASETNLGCGHRVSTGLDWVFERTPEAIVLEDDCLPHPSFFRFCDQLLERYRSEERVMHISGNNFQSVGRRRGSLARVHGAMRRAPSYYFSRYPHVWGWASWSRAWAHYDAAMTAWTDAEDYSAFLAGFSDPSERDFWRDAWDAVAEGRIDTWDYQWVFACIAEGGISAMPGRNLVSNIGFGDASTHTGGASELANMPTGEIGFPLRHPKSVAVDVAADRHTARIFFGARA
jgi:hypothetical protein